MPDKKIYVYIPGTTQPTVLSPEEYETKKEKLFTKYTDAQVVEMEGYKNGDDVGESDFFVNIPGTTMPTQISAKDFAAKKDKIYAAYPDVQVSRIKPVNYWGNKLTEIYDRIEVLNNELQGLPPEMDNVSEDPRSIQADSIAEMQNIMEQRRNSPDRQRRREITQELNQLFRMREENPAWQKYWANTNAEIDSDYQRIVQMQAELIKTNPEADKHYRNANRLAARPGMGLRAAVEAAESDPKYNSAIESFAAARLMLDDAKKAASAPSRYGGDDKGAGSDFWQGVVDGAPEALSAAQLMRAGLNIHLIDAIKKIQQQEADGAKTDIRELVKKDYFDTLGYLNAGEKELVKAFVKKAEVEAGRSDNVGGKAVSQIARSYQSGQSAIQSVGFMADFALFGGIGEKAAEATVGGLVKAAGRNELAKLGAETLYGTVKALAMTPLMPSSYSSFVNNLLQMNDAGAVDLSGKRMLQAGGDVIIENISETVGSKPLELIALPLNKVKFPSWAGALRSAPIMQAFKQAGYNGFFEEMVEEWTGNALRVMTGVDKDALKDFATIDKQLVTAGAFAPMSLFGLPLSMAQYHAASKDMRNKGTALETILHGLEGTKNLRLNVENIETPEELGNYMSGIYRSIVENGGDEAEAYRAVLEYTEAVGRYKMLDGAFEQQKDIERSRRTAEINNTIGDSTWYHEGRNGNNFVRVITYADGNERFVVAEQDGSMAVVDRNGNRSFISEQELAEGVANGQLTDSGEQYLFDYLDRQTETQRETNEQERMSAETQQANAQLIQQAQPGMQVNLGTTENPEMATILGVDGGNYIVQKTDGTTALFTPQEMAEKLGINTTPKTDAQIEEEQAALIEKREKNREFANLNYKGKSIKWNGQQYTIVGVTRGRDSINTDGSVKEWAYDVQVTDANGQSRTIGMTDHEFDGLLETLFNDTQQAAENGEPVTAPVQEETPAAPVEDNTPRDFRGNPLPMRTNKRTGQQVVDENALWNKDPEAWARWNDNNPNQRVTSKERLEDQIKDLDKQIEKDTKAVHNAALKGIDADKMDDMEADLAQKIERRNLLSSILDRYNMPAAAGPTIAGEQRKAAAEQTIAQQQAGFPGIQQKWNNAPKIVGAADEIRLANGETISGHYVLTDAMAPTPSHNPSNGFAMTEGFPVDENGKTVNDRDYEHDQAAQKAVMEKAEHYDQRALQTPVIVSNDGVVLSGNDRTMASQIAAANNTDGAYTDYLAKYPQKYGFTAEQVGQFQHPRVVFVPDAKMPYNAATFAKFNAEDKKSQSKTENAVKAGKIITAETLGPLASLVDRYDDINALYNDAAGVDELLNILIVSEVVSPEQIAALKDGDTLSGTGMDLLESTLIGAALDEEAVRIAMADKSIRKSIVSAVAQIIVGNTLADYTLRAELTDAIQLVAAGKSAKEIKFGESVQSYIRQQHLFEEDVVAEATVQMLADAINDRKPSFLKKVLSLYNRDAVDSVSGQLNLLTGDILTREAILRNILEYLGYDTNIIFDTSEREAERRAAAAEQPAGPAAEAGPAQQNDAPVQSDAGSTVAQFNREEVAAILEQAGWETRPNTEIQGFDGLDSYSVYNACDEYIDRIIGETGLNIAQVDMIAVGSRAFGTAKEDSDLDILVEYEGDVKEDAVFNALNTEPLEIMGIKVDFFPIRSQESGTMTEWLASHDNGRPVAQEQPKEGTKTETPAVQEINVEGLLGAVSDMYAGKRSEVKLSDFAEPVQEESRTVGELGKYTHTKTGKEMSIVRLTGDRLSADEFKRLKTRAKEFGGYYSSFGSAKGFLFDNEEDAIKFNNINTTTNVSENTDRKTASDTAIISSEAASVASKAEAIAESEEPADERTVNRTIQRIDDALDKIDGQLALLGYYEADQTGPFHESYGYMKSAEKKAVKDADRLAKKLAADLGIDVGRKTLAKANIAPAGGEVSFRLPLNDGHELYMCINLMPNGYQPGYGYEDDLVVRGTLGGGSLAIYFRVENPNASGQARYVTPNNHQPYNVTYADLLKAVRRDARNFLPEAPAETSPANGPVDILQVAKEQVEKNRKSRKKTISSQEDGDAMLGGLFDTLYEAEDNTPEVDETPAPAQRVKPTEVNGFAKGEKVIYIPDQGKRSGQEQEATIYDFEYDGRPVLDTGLAPVLYEVVDWNQIRKIENEPVNNTDDGLQRLNEPSAEGTPADGGGQQQGLQRGTGEESEVHGQESERTDRGGERGREGDVHGRPRALRPRYDDSVKRNTRNYRRNKEDSVPTTIAARYKANIAAIRLLKELQDSGKTATKEQMAVLRQYTGWGGLGGYFNNEYSPEYREMRSLLTDEEMQAAALSINTAYYTPTEIIESMWDVAKRLGFEGGNVLEGSAGIGNILASMPKSISERSAITAVELDNITGGILQQLYPDANVQIKGFQEVDIPNGSIDLAITNVPFGDINVYDSKEKDLTRKFGGKIHDFCIAKNIRKLAEGGIGIFISSRGTLDGSSKALRQWVVNEGNADVIGAFRLNNATFEGTKATSDIIVVRKRVNGQVSPNAINVTDTEITRRVDYQTNETEWNKNTRSWEPIIGKAAMELNSYFVEHPENMGGEMGFGFEHNDTYRPGSSALWPSEKIDQQKRLAKWVKQFSSMQEEVAPTVSESESIAEDASATKEGQLITNSKGEICISRSGKAVPIAVNAQKVKGYSKAQVLADYDALKTAINEVLDYQLNNESDEGLKPLLDKLNKAYDRFAKRYDRLNRNTAISFLRNDVDFPSIAAVEDYREKKDIGGKVKIEVKKTSIFSGRVLGAKRIPTPSNAKDGVIVSINQFGRIDIPFIAEALNKDEETVRKEILASGLGFENPLTGNVDVEYEYLSGNVREKLEYARVHNTEGQYDKNIDALEKVIPADIPAHLIEFSLGSDWMPVELYTEYAKEKFGVNDNFVPTMVGGSWILPENTWEMGVNTEKNRAAGVHSEKLRTDKVGHELMIAAMNNTSVVFSRSYRDPATGETITEHDKEATQAATTKMSEMRDDFKEWCKAKMLDTPELAERIAKIYNDTFNAIVPKEIRDTFIPEHFDGMATKLNNGKPLNLRQHQAKAVIRATTEPLMMAHEVGTGKTFTLIATAMEMRRLGTAKKPMIVVQNATLGQFVSSAKELYPNAKILTISESDRTVEGRSAFYAKIKYNDWDMIVVPQSVFEMIPDSEERQRAFIQEKIDEKKFILEQVKQAKNSTVERQLKKELEDLEYEYQYGEKPPKKGKGGKKDAKKEAEAVENAVAKAKKQLDRRTDDVSDFDDMGIDALLIDEAHSYKHLGFSTAMQRGVKGVDATGSKKSAGVYLKTRAVFDKVGWKNVVFATGTPISNTAAEIWTFMKYLMPADVMRQHHIYYFDDFVRNFGNISQSLEFTTSGKFKETTRFASYTNLPELIRIWSSVTDTVRSKDAVAEGDEKLEDKQPKMEGGQARDIYLPQSISLVDIMNAVRAKLEWYEGLSGKEKKENSYIPLTMFGIAKMAAIDPRLVDRNAQDEPNSKTNKAVEETLQALKDSERYKGTAALFCDNFRRWDYNDAGKRVEGFNIFEEIKRKLVAAGVPEGQIVIMKSGMTTAAKEKIFARVNSGEVRVIMGTTATLGTGVNIQERLFFEAHLDAPNRPMDYTQRNGRILRQGNLHKEWDIPVRVVRFGVEDSLDVTAYQRLSTKAKFIDSIMDGKPLLANGMENRVLEEEDEGEFDNPVAVLSGSQYALLKSQAERELRKLRNKKEQHRQDQIYIERTLKENKSRIAYDEMLINEANANLAKVKAAFPDGAVKEVTIEGRKAKGAEQIAEAIKDKITTPLRSRLDSRRVERGFTNETLNYTMTFDGVPVNIKVDVERLNEYDDKRHEYRPVMRTRVEYSVPRFGIEGRFVQGGYTSIKDIVPDFMSKIATGRYFEDAVNNLTNTANRLNSDNEFMLLRRGKPFAEEDKLTEQEKIVAYYTEKMKAELAEKEAKYAEMAKNATTSFNLDNVEVDEDEEGEGETHNSDVRENAPKLDVNDPMVFAEAISAVNRLAKRLGLRVVFDDKLEDKGAYTEGTDYVRINLANCESVDDAVETLLHEGVAHFGLREMLGEEGMKQFIADLLAKASPSIRTKIEAMAAENGWSMEYAAEEYVAELAQKTDYTRAERSFWREILQAVRNLISNITGRDTYITDDVIREMLVASYANLEEQAYNSADNRLASLTSAVQGMSRFDSDYIPTQKKRREIIEDYIEGIRGGDKDVAVVSNEEFLTKAAEWGLGKDDTETLNVAIRIVRVGGKTFDDGRIIIFSDNIEDIEQARLVYVHERQHYLTNTKRAEFIERVVRSFDGIGGPEYTRLYLKDAVRRIGRTDAYRNYDEKGLAEEFVSFAMQLAYTDENFVDDMEKLYIRPAAIEIIKELDNEQRKENSLSAARKRTNNDASNRRRNQATDENRAGVSEYGYNRASEEVGGIPEEGITHYRRRTKPAPKNTGIGYKVFFRGKDGKLYPPMVANPNGEATPVGVWLDADAAPIAGQSKTGRPQVKAGGKGTQGGSGMLAYRPGWHLGEIPYAIQFNRINPKTGQKEWFPREFVWAEVEYATDKDYQNEADREGMTDEGKYRHSYAGLKRVPEDGFYRYRTNPNPETDPWIITGSMKVNRILTDEEVDNLVRDAGREPQEREPIVRNRVAEGVEGFLSNAEEAVRGIIQEKATPQQWLKMIESRGGLKAGEDKWVGLSDWLKASDKKTITKQEVLDYINENKIQIEETTYWEEGDEKALDTAHPGFTDAYYTDMDEFYNKPILDGVRDLRAAVALYNREHEDQITFQEGDPITRPDSIVSDDDWDKLLDFGKKILDNEDVLSGRINPTRDSYTTEGLSNKREIALSVPTIEPWNTEDKVHFGDAGEGRAIAWARFGDAVISMNGKALFIDEIQSKRHQEGREQGYKEISDKERQSAVDARNSAHSKWEQAKKDVNDYLRSIFGENYNVTEGSVPKEYVDAHPLTDEQNMRLAELSYAVKQAERELDEAQFAVNENLTKQKSDIPMAPFEKNWHELAMKRMLRLAAEEGYDYMVWTTGEQQAERYNIGGVVKKIVKSDDYNIHERTFAIFMNEGIGFQYITTDEEGNVVTTIVEDFRGKNLSEIFGKELAVRMLTMKEGETIEGDGLRIGGEGMKGFYDEILPRFMNKYAKKWGVQVEDKALYDLGDGPLKVHAIRITPEMKESVMKGQLMFREGTESTPSPVSYSESMGARRLSASETARKCGIEIEFRPSAQMQFNGKPLAGRWINGKMQICLEHCRDAADAVRTVLHEGVGHNGLRKLIGDENMTAFCLDMFRRLPDRARREIAEAAINKYGADIAEATEEYLAERAEVMDFENEDYERNFWDIVLDGLRKMLAKVGINIPLSQRDVRWLMWQSYNANKQTDVLNEAKRQVVAHKLGFTFRQLADKGEAVQIARNRMAEEELAPAARIYNKDVVYWLNRLHETWVDKDNSVHSLVEAIEKATGKDAAAFEDIRFALNQQSSKGLAAIGKWERENWIPMQDAITALMKEKGCDLHAIERYVMIKHGLERNEVFAKRDAKEYYQDLHDRAVKAIDKAQEDGKIDKSLRDTMVAKEDANLDKHIKSVDAGTDVKYKELRRQDYSGLTAMYSEYDAFEPFQEGLESNEEYQARVLKARHPKYTYIDENGREQVDMAATEDAAMKEVEDFERGYESSVDELWKRINNATKATLKHQYDANMIGRQQYLKVKDMFKFYVPLRGFADNTAEDMYDYYLSDRRNDFTPPLLKAKGHTTEAESPFGYIGSMASSGIAADMKNETKLTLYYFVSNRASNDLVSISEVWYKNTGMTEDGKRIFTPVYPPFTEDLSREDAKKAYENWEKQMQEEAKAGFAFKSSRKLNLHNSVIHIDNSQKDSHVIKFKVGGRDMMMFINGNPRAAQAINNELNVEMSADYQKLFGRILRWFSGINTSYNPEFWMSNAQRDALFALMSVDVKEDSEYGRAFRENFGRLFRSTLTPGAKGGLYSLKKKMDSGKLGDDRLDVLYAEFVENGGITGYTTLKNNEEWELELRKYTGQEKQAVKAVKTAFEKVQNFGEAIEQMTRFAAYITSRERGKEIKDAVNDAKELTVNFNRKGSGKAISFKEADRLRTKSGKKLTPVQKAFVVAVSWLPVYGRRFIMFFNASVQGLNAMYKLYKKDGRRMAAWTAGYFALGVLQAVIHAMLDDDDDYLDIPDYERRNNLLLGGKGVYFKWALPQEARVFYGIGDMAVNHIMGRTPNKSILTEILESASDIAPLNPSGGLSAIAPSALTPIVEVALNRDYKGSKIFNDMRYLSDEERKRTPAYQKAYSGTGKVYVLLSQFANWLSGGDYADAGWLNINPAAVEHILQGATGGAGTTLEKLYKGTVGQVLGEDFIVRNTPFLSRLFTVTDDRYRNAHTTELFDFYKAEAEHTKKLINTYRKNGDYDKLDRLYDSEDYEIMQVYESYKGQMKYYSDELKFTTDSKQRKALMREQDALRKEMILEISNIGNE